MKTFLLSCIILLLCASVNAQNIVSGKILDENAQAVPGANIAIKDSYDGGSSDSTGNFSFRTSETGTKILQIGFLGYKRIEKEITIGDGSKNLSFTLQPEETEIRAVTITAGTFETGDLKKPLTLKPMDIAMTPSALGDIYGAFTTLPGSQIVGKDGGLFVRGGEGYETKTFIDGMLVANPYSSNMPDLPTRGRYSPMLFDGTAFSTGGYSAEYGQALSSEINLTTNGLALKSEHSYSIFSVGLSASLTKRWENASLRIDPEYYNMSWIYSLMKDNMQWKKHPESLGGNVLFRKKFGKYGMLKVFASGKASRSSLYYQMTGDTAKPTLIKMNDYDIYVNAVYSTRLSSRWSLRNGVAVSQHEKKMDIGENKLSGPGTTLYQKMTLTNSTSGIITWKIGEEIAWNKYERSYFEAASQNTYKANFHLFNFAAFAEPTIQFSKNFVMRVGSRAEYSTLSAKLFVEPRLSLTYKVCANGSLAAAFGNFHQKAEDDYLVYNNQLKDERATHYILNYQYEKDNRIFRAEVFAKTYKDLVQYKVENYGTPDNFYTGGSGYATGVDFFWRDSKTWKRIDYWITYSFLDTKRQYKNYPEERMPTFVSPHTFSAVMKYQMPNNKFWIGLTYMFASSKTYYSPNPNKTTTDKTGNFNDISTSLTYVKPLDNCYMVFFGSLNNILGFSNTYGFNYSQTPNTEGEYARYPIKPNTKRFFVAGLMFYFQ